MYRSLLPYLQCSTCAYAPVSLSADREAAGEVVVGELRCERCGRVTPIRDGVIDALGAAPVPWTPAQITNYLPIAAWGYERLWRGRALSLLSGGHFPLRKELRMVRGLMEPTRGGLILDVACSTGLYARAFASAGGAATIAAVDHSWPMLQEARRFARREGRAISFVRASAQALPFRPGSAAGYGMGGSLNEIGDIDAALGEARRVLGADGRMVSMHLVRAESSPGRWLQQLLASGGVQFPEAGALNRRFTDAGFRRAVEWRWRVVAINLLLPKATQT